MAPDSRKLQMPGDAPQIGESLVKPYSYKTPRGIKGPSVRIYWGSRCLKDEKNSAWWFCLILGVPINPVAYMDPYTSIQIRRESIYLDKYYIYILYLNQSGQLIVIHQTEKSTGIRASISYHLLKVTMYDLNHPGWFPGTSCHFPGETLLTELGFPTMTARKLFFNSSASVECVAMESFHRTQFHASFWTAKGYTSCFFSFLGNGCTWKTTLRSTGIIISLPLQSSCHNVEQIVWYQRQFSRLFTAVKRYVDTRNWPCAW